MKPKTSIPYVKKKRTVRFALPLLPKEKEEAEVITLERPPVGEFDVPDETWEKVYILLGMESPPRLK